ncbi:MAG: hypothetical protein GXP08_13540 [Gammaproteobacteria bacterium]|nr:hypothetical protein [Gammaproteobacteria bacterium]
MSTDKSQNALFVAVFKLIRPLVRALLRNGVPYGAFADIAKRAYVDIAMTEFEVPGKKPTISRAATITGLSRKEISRLMTIDGGDDRDMVAKYNRAARVVYGWVHDIRYADENGQAAVLPFEGESVSFSALVKAYSGDVPPRAILDELAQVGVVEYVNDDGIRLLARAYIPKSGEAEKLSLLGRDVAGLIATMDKNIHNLGEKPFFQRKVFYDNLPLEVIPELQAILEERGQNLLEYLDQWMAEHDRDVNPKLDGTGRKAAGIGLYYFEENIENYFEKNVEKEQKSAGGNSK